MSQESTTASCSISGQKRSLRIIEDEKMSTKCIKFDTIDGIFTYYTSLSEFCIGGKLELSEKTSKLFYKASNGTIRCIDFLNISKEEIDTLIDSCRVSPFGMGGQSVVDPDVRQAKELREKDFAFQFFPQMKSSVSSQVKKLLGNREFVIQPYKLNVYSEGGHFRRHKDTLKNERMIASLVVCLPVAFEGGVLTVENERGQSVSFDWGKEMSQSTSEKNTVQWACFFCSCDHFISKITEGNRITIAYDVFTDDSKHKCDRNDLSNDEDEAVPEQYRAQCIEKLQNYAKTLDSGRIYGYFPNHVYCFGDTEEGNTLRNTLKGNDLLLYDVLTQAGWNVILQVYYPDINSYGPYIDFNVDEGAEFSVPMNQAISKDDIQRLQKISDIEWFNHLRNSKELIHDYEVCYGYTGNSPIRETKCYYAGTVMIFRHQTRSERKEDDIEISELNFK